MICHYHPINSDPVSREHIIRILSSREFSENDQRDKPINWASKLNSPEKFFEFLKELQGGSPSYIEQLYKHWSKVQEIRDRDVHNETIFILMDLLKYSTKQIEVKPPPRGGKKKSKRKRNQSEKRNQKNKKSKRKYKRKHKTKIKRKHKKTKNKKEKTKIK